MKSITLQSPTGKTSLFQMASCYSELNEKQLQGISFLYKNHIAKLSQQDKEAMKIALLPYMLTPQPALELVLNIPAATWVDIYPHLEWIFETPRFTKWPSTFLDKLHKELHAPVEMLRTSSILEMTTMDDAFVIASKEKDFTKVYEIIACLFRPMRKDIHTFKKSAEWNGDVREPFNQYTVKERAQKLQRTVSKITATSVYLYAKSFHDVQLVEKFQNLFPVDEQKEEGAPEVVRVGNNYGWPGVILEMSNTKFGDLEKTKAMNWYTVLFEMSRQVDIAKQRIENSRK
jgi:hypothetical protein